MNGRVCDGVGGVAAPVPRPTVGTGPASECGATMEGTTGWF